MAFEREGRRRLPTVFSSDQRPTFGNFGLAPWAARLIFVLLIGPAVPGELLGELWVGTVAFEGNSHFSDEELGKSISLKTGEAFDQEKVHVAQTLLVSFLRGRGYLDSEVSVQTTARGTATDIRFHIKEGSLYRFGDTRVLGLTDYPPRVVFREIPYKEGDPYLQKDLFEAQSRLYNLGLFEDIRISTAAAAPGIVDIDVRLKVRRTRTIGGGVGYGSEERQRLSLIYTDRNLFHRSYTLDLTGEYSAIWLETKAELTNRYLFGTRTEGKGELSWRNEEREGYELERTLGRTNFARRLRYRIVGEAGYKLQRSVVFNVSPDVAATLPDSSLLTSALEAGLARDNSDHPFFPTRGSRLGVNFQRSGGFLGGDVHLNKVSVTAAGYAKVAGPVVAAGQARTGVVRPFPPSNEVPIFEKFFTGGANSVRGYRERGVGPKDAADNPLGGNQWAGASVEIRFPVVWKFNGAVFVDGGQVAATRGGVRPSDWKYGTGGGLRLVTPVGPLRLDYGYKLNRSPDDEDLWRLHFSLGETF